MPALNNVSSLKIPSFSQTTVARSKSKEPTCSLRNLASEAPNDGLARRERAKNAYNRLRGVGMPDEIGFDAFLELYRGKEVAVEGKESKKEKVKENASRQKKGTRTKDAQTEDPLTGSGPAVVVGVGPALDSLSERLVGRTQVAKVRQRIAAAQAQGESEDLAAQEEAKRESLSRVLASVKAEWEVESRKVKELEERKEFTGRQVDGLKRKVLLLDVLEGLESVRIKRLGCIRRQAESTTEDDGLGMGDLIDALRQEVALTSREIGVVLSNAQKRTPPTSSSVLTKGHQQAIYSRPEVAFHHSRVALANLHAYHTHLQRVQAAQLTAEPTLVHPLGDNLERRLENALRGVGAQPGTELRKVQMKVMAVAKRRAATGKRPLPSVCTANASLEDLNEKQLVNESKRKEVQRLLDRVVAVGWVCEGYVDLISTFRQETAPALEKLLDEEQKRVEGRIDLMKTEVLKALPPPEPGFAQQVRDGMGSTKLKVWEDIEDTFKRSSKLKLVKLKRLEVALPVEIPDHSQLLKRKTTKAEHGYGIAEEVRRLLDGSKKLKYV